MKELKVAVTQMPCGIDVESNIKKAEELVQNAASKGAQLILLQELFSTVYFCQEYNYDYFEWAHPAVNNPLLMRMQNLAQKLKVVLPISFFEKSNTVFYNSIAIIDADGTILGTYRKTHIPDDPGYYEKFYFTPGEDGFKVWDTKYARIGVGICWDQWFPEVARCMVLQGAEILLYPTAIGTIPVHNTAELQDAVITNKRWQRAMIGHAVANMVPVMASNRIGIQHINDTYIRFYGSSFITDGGGEMLIEANQYDEGTFVATVDLEAYKDYKYLRFRDRRIDQYGLLFTKDGRLL